MEKEPRLMEASHPIAAIGELPTNRRQAAPPHFGWFSGPSFWETQLAPFFEKYFFILCLSLVGVACARMIPTYTRLSLTNDEPIHFACGLEYVAKHVYGLETQHPPLSRAVQAFGPYLAGARPLNQYTTDDLSTNVWWLSVIANSGNVERTIFLMRLGNLPFFLLACLVVCCWSWQAFGKPVAVVATGLFTLLPTMLADGALATTDMALGATVGAAFLAAIRWAERPTWRRALLLGLCTALACLSKFSALGYLPASLCLALAFYLAVCWPSWRGLWKGAMRLAPTFALAAATTATLIWAGYWFSFGKVHIHGGNFTLPAPEFFDGIRSVVNHTRRGHPAFLLGEFRTTGWWYYFPVALAVKTPIAFLILLVLGIFVCLRECCRPGYIFPIAFCLGVLLPAMRSRIDIGIRHIEPIYIGLSIISALGLVQLLRWARTGVISALTGGILVAWMAISGAVQHPDYLAYFNTFAGNAPENILVDSNYDWGQDLRLLAKRLHELGVKEFSLASLDDVPSYEYFESWYHLPNIKEFNTAAASPGWTVVSPTFDKSWVPLHGLNVPKPWYDQVTPHERVGPLLLYYVPPATRPDPSDDADPKKH
jgi:hypothetical protein